MSLTLSARDLEALELTQAALLSPFDYRNTEAWRVVASARVTGFIGADQGVFSPPRATPGSARRRGQATDIGGADVTPAEQDKKDVSARLRRRTEAYHYYRLYRATLGTAEISVDWAESDHAVDTRGNTFDPFEGELIARGHLLDVPDEGAPTRQSISAVGERGLTLVRLLLPAFKAGVRTRLAFLSHREALGGLLDRIADGAAVWDRSGNCRYRNRALVDLLATDAERFVLEKKLAEVGRRMLKWPAANGDGTVADVCDVTVVTAANRYRLQATYAAGLGTGDPWVLVLVRPRLRLPSAAWLRTRHGLTPRQSEVAQRLAAGQSDVAIARALGISRRTAEHHAEGVRLHLGVHSRAALAAALQQSV